MSPRQPKPHPLRRVVVRDSCGYHVLECGHMLPCRYTAYGMSLTQDRCRCAPCDRRDRPDYTIAQVIELEAACAEGGPGVEWDPATERYVVLQRPSRALSAPSEPAGPLFEGVPL